MGVLPLKMAQKNFLKISIQKVDIFRMIQLFLRRFS